MNPGQSAELVQSGPEIRSFNFDIRLNYVSMGSTAVTVVVILVEIAAGCLLLMKGAKDNELPPGSPEVKVGASKKLWDRYGPLYVVDPILKGHGIRKGHGWLSRCLRDERGEYPGSCPSPLCKWTSVFHL